VGEIDVAGEAVKIQFADCATLIESTVAKGGKYEFDELYARMPDST